MPDTSDNCPDDANPDQTNTDADLNGAGAKLDAGPPEVPLPSDGQGDECDSDDDNDMFDDAVETFVSTNPLDNCSAPTGIGSGGDALPADTDADGDVDLDDMLAFKPSFGALYGDANYNQRFDIFTDFNTNVSDPNRTRVNLDDVLAIKPYFGKTGA